MRLSLLVLVWLSCPASPCPSLEQSLASSDLVAEVSLVSRSRAQQGHYYATFRTDKILQIKEEAGGGGSTHFVSSLQLLLSPSLHYFDTFRRVMRDISDQTGGREARVRVRRGKVAAGEEKEKTNTRLSCSARGNPPPTLYWTMDGKIVKNTGQTRIITKNLSKFLRKSVLKLKPSVTNRSLRLQCHAYNEFGHTSKVKMTKPVRKRAKSRAKSRARSLTQLKGIRSNIGFKPKGGLLGQSQDRAHLPALLLSSAVGGKERSRSPLYSSECPIPDYCMNGGRCQYYSIIGEQSCHCEKGYHGQRCERKYVNSNLEGPRMSDKFPMCLLGIAHYPCP